LNLTGVLCRRLAKYFLAGAVFLSAVGIARTTCFAAGDLDEAVAALQKKYSQIRDLRMEFIQNYQSPLRRSRSETGVLFLRRPGMMRWEYKQPDEKLFVSDGKTIIFYLPEDRQVQRTSVKESQDQRLPFLFLLGRGNLKKDFSRLEWASDTPPFFAGNKLLYAYPKKSVSDCSKVLMEYDGRSMQLQRIVIYSWDGSKSEFIFTNIKENSGLGAGLFDFKIPPNVEIVGAPGEGE
jgi:outer membrane lipoprotein carrier protein